MSEHLNHFKNDNIMMARAFNIYAMNSAKPVVSEYLNVLSGLAIENVSSDFTSGETMRNEMTKACINHILLCLDDFVAPGAIRD